jgi:hypothetical protein
MENLNISPKELVDLNSSARRHNNSTLEEIEEIWGIFLGQEEKEKIESRDTEIFSRESVADISNLLLIFNESLFKIKKGDPLTEILYLFVKNSGFLDSLIENENMENQFKVSNINKFFELIQEYERENPNSNI